MARISGVDIPRDKRVVISLTYIFGIGKPTAQKILKDLGISEDRRVKDLTEEELTAIDDVGAITAAYIRSWIQNPQSQHLIARLQEAGVSMQSAQ